MPLTPFHLGPALLFGLLLFKFVDFPTSLVASVILDVEPFIVLFFGLNYPLHGFFHSFVGGSIVAVVLGFVMLRLSSVTTLVMTPFKLEQKFSSNSVFLASFLGTFSHILLDSVMHGDIMPFYPFGLNPFFGGGWFIGVELHAFCLFCFFAGVVLYGAMLIVKGIRRPKASQATAQSVNKEP